MLHAVFLLFFLLISQVEAKDNLTLWVDIDEKDYGLYLKGTKNAGSVWGWLWPQRQKLHLGVMLPFLFIGPPSLSGLYQRVHDPDLVYAWSSSLRTTLGWRPYYGKNPSRMGVRFTTGIFSGWMWKSKSSSIYGVDLSEDLGNGLRVQYLFAQAYNDVTETGWFHAFKRISDVTRMTTSLQYRRDSWLVLGEYDLNIHEIPGHLFRGAVRFDNSYVESGLHLSYLTDAHRLWDGTRAEWHQSVSAYMRNQGPLQGELKLYVQKENYDFLSDSQARTWISSGLTVQHILEDGSFHWKPQLSVRNPERSYTFSLELNWESGIFQLWGRGQWQQNVMLPHILVQAYTFRIVVHTPGVIRVRLDLHPETGIQQRVSIHLPLDQSQLSLEAEIDLSWRRTQFRWHLRWRWVMPIKETQ